MQTPRFSGISKSPQFCSRCAKPLMSGDAPGGGCLWDGCKSPLCGGCWHQSKFRFCDGHAGGGKPARHVLMKPREHDLPDVTPGIRALHEARLEGREGKLRYYASEYWRWLSARIGEVGPVDWTPHGILKNPVAESAAAATGDSYCTKVMARGLFRKKHALSIIAIPCDWSRGFDASSLHAAVSKTARMAGGHCLVVLVGDGVPMEASDFVNRFADSRVSLYLAEPRRGHLNYNIRDPVTRSYSEWFSQERRARRFREKVRDIGSLVDGRSVVSEDAIEREFGFRRSDTADIIKSCGFLYPAGAEGKYYVGEV
jgi:hypothetical protein